MPKLFPDKTFYPSAKMAMEATPESYAYVTVLQTNGSNKPDAMVKIDTDEKSSTYGQVIDRLDMLNVGE